MKYKEPTQEQFELFWKWYGFKRLEYGKRGYHFEHSEKVMNWLPPDGKNIYDSMERLPRISLENLFEYAVPKLQPEVIKFVPVTGVDKQFDYGLKWGCHLTLKGWERTKAVISDNSDPALALFWAIYAVMEANP